MLELIARDAGGRCCKWTLGSHTITTPNIAIVINPNKLVVPPEQLLKDFRAQIIITNAYIIYKSRLRAKAAEQGLHKLLKWNGPIYTDSGTYQMYSQGKVDIEPDEIVRFQSKLGSDLITPLDVFTFPSDSASQAAQKLSETIARVARTKQLVSRFTGPIQGGRYLQLRARACKQIAALEPELFAIGGIVPYMEQYKFTELADILLKCKASLPPHKPIHAFGAGHPMLFALLAALGCDLFDSAMYSLAAERDAYLTVNGTYALEQLSEFPCACPLCSRSEPDQIKLLEPEQRLAWLARHNLYVTFTELRTVRTAIRENSLWELVQLRARAHPAILQALKFALKKYSKLFQKLDLVSKRSAFMWGGPESALRPEVLRAKQWLKRVKPKQTFTKEPFGKIPLALKHVYPFGQSLIPGFKEPKKEPKPKSEALAIIKYQYGSFSKQLEKAKVEVSRRTKRIRRLWLGKKLLGTFRPHDHFFLPTLDCAHMLPMKRVEIDPEAAAYVSKGRAAFVKFVSPLSEIYAGEEVAVVHKGKVIAIGRALLNSDEMRAMQRGVAIDIRAHS